MGYEDEKAALEVKLMSSSKKCKKSSTTGGSGLEVAGSVFIGLVREGTDTNELRGVFRVERSAGEIAIGDVEVT